MIPMYAYFIAIKSHLMNISYAPAFFRDALSHDVLIRVCCCFVIWRRGRLSEDNAIETALTVITYGLIRSSASGGINHHK